MSLGGPPGVEDVKQFNGLAPGDLAAAVVLGGGVDVGVSRELLDSGDVRAAVEQIPDELPSEIVGGERWGVVLAGTVGEHVQEGLVHQALDGDLVGLVDGAEQGPGFGPADFNPAIERQDAFENFFRRPTYIGRSQAKTRKRSLTMNSISSELRGTVQLNHAHLPVDMVYATCPSEEFIKSGDDTFELTSYNPTHFYGKATGEATGNVGKAVSIIMSPETIAKVVKDPAQFADDLNIDNKSEFCYRLGDNALIVQSDYVNGSRGVGDRLVYAANFANLAPVQPPDGAGGAS